MKEFTIPHCGVALTSEKLGAYLALKLPVTVKIGGVELSKDEAYTLYTQGQYIVTRSRIYQICFGGKGEPHFFGRVVYRYNELHPGVRGGFTLPHRWTWMTKAEVEKFIAI